MSEVRGEVGAGPGARAPLSPEAERALHARLLARDALAPSELAETYLPPLLAWAARAFAWLDPHLVETIAIDAVLAVVEQPARYDPTRGSLATYLRMAIRGDVKNALQSAGRRAGHELPLEPVELARAARNRSVERDDDPADLAARGEALDPALGEALRAAFDATELEVIWLMVDDERRTGEYAKLLGIDHLGAAEQAREVKRAKDRLKKRLQRLAPRVRRDE